MDFQIENYSNLISDLEVALMLTSDSFLSRDIYLLGIS
jgi:hypothetical protein